MKSIKQCLFSLMWLVLDNFAFLGFFGIGRAARNEEKRKANITYIRKTSFGWNWRRSAECRDCYISTWGMLCCLNAGLLLIEIVRLNWFRSYYLEKDTVHTLRVFVFDCTSVLLFRFNKFIVQRYRLLCIERKRITTDFFHYSRVRIRRWVWNKLGGWNTLQLKLTEV